MFCNGLLVPVLKKNTLDPSIAKNYRPVTMSMLLEQLILKQCQDHIPNAAQFGFLNNRGTNNMATSLAHDIGVLSTNMGSSIYYCSLDAEGAFDMLPHSVLLQKAINVIPDPSWLLVHYWYNHMNICIRWGNNLSEKIQDTRGTKQGGLSSPFFFNVFYEDLIDRLQSCKYGVNISGLHLNTICYADDILLCSASVSGLQKLINIATEYIISHGLRFNPVKTECLIKGPNPFTTTPQWNMDGVALKLEDTITYLGTTIGDKNGKVHTGNRSRAASPSFYGLQGAGIKFPGVGPILSLEMYRMAVQSTMLYGCATIYMSTRNLFEKRGCWD